MDSMEKIIDHYQSRIEDLESQLRELKNRSSWYSTIRFLVFTGIIVCTYFYFTNEYPSPLLVVALVLLVVFFFLVNRHLAIKYQLSVKENLIKINHNEISILRREPSFLPDGGIYHKDFTYTADLDIFGPRSLYHMLHRCFSPGGRDELARWMIEPEMNRDAIRTRQEAIASVVERIDLRQLFLAHGLVHFTGDEHRFDTNESLMPPATFRKIKWLRWILPLITLVSILGALWTGYYKFIAYGFILNLVITGLFSKTTASVLTRTETNFKTLRHYLEPLKLLIRDNYHNELFREKKQNLAEAYARLRVLQKRYDLLENRINMIVGTMLNGLIGYDFLVLGTLQSWYDSNIRKVPEWLDEIAWVESVFSLATFAYNNPSYAFPFLDRATGISGSNIRHPFIPDLDNVGNALNFTHPLKVILLTGSNMSGKSTFLRSIGVNQVLALSGSVVAADEFHTGLYGILTSFRKADSIQEHTSLFYDELKKLQFIFTTLDKSTIPQLVLLDEILRGTNSDDKYFGSKQVLLRLKDQSAMTILATHDIDLAQLEDGHDPLIQNYSFESQIRNGELHFDYKLHKGIAVNKNATFLMQKMGIIAADHK